jgi:hypothetical protein
MPMKSNHNDKHTTTRTKTNHRKLPKVTLT